MQSRPVALAALTALAVAASCSKNPYLAFVDGAMLAECDQVVPAEAGPTVAVKVDDHEEDVAIPAGPVVRLAVDRAVSWRRMADLIKRVKAAGARPVLLVGVRDDVFAVELTERLAPGKHLTLDITPDGKFCLGHPDADRMYCVQSYDRHHIARSFIRESLPDAIKKYGIADIEVRVQPSVDWGDVVRAVDGARTCCTKTVVHASLVDAP